MTASVVGYMMSTALHNSRNLQEGENNTAWRQLASRGRDCCRWNTRQDLFSGRRYPPPVIGSFLIMWSRFTFRNSIWGLDRIWANSPQSPYIMSTVLEAVIKRAQCQPVMKRSCSQLYVEIADSVETFLFERVNLALYCNDCAAVRLYDRFKQLLKQKVGFF